MTSGNSEERVAYAAALLAQGEYRDALSLLEKVLSADPSGVEAQAMLARTHVHLGELDEAERVCMRVLGEHPSDVPCRINLALIRMRRGDADQAVTLLTQVVDGHESHRRAWGYLGVAYEMLGRVDDAEAALLRGHHHDAARRLRERAAGEAPGSSPRDSITSFRESIPTSVRRAALDPEIPKAPWIGFLPSVGAPRHTATLRPPDLRHDSLAPPTTDGVRSHTEVPPEALVGQVGAGTEPELSALLDAALSALVVLPAESVLSMHETGLLCVSLSETEGRDHSCVARTDAVFGTAGDVATTGLVHAKTRFSMLSGEGKAILSPRIGHRLVPLQLDVELTYLRGDRLLGYDARLLFDTARVRVSDTISLPFIHFRGDGYVILELERPFVAFDVRQSMLRIRQSRLLGWIGELSPERDTGPDDHSPDPFLVLRGEGTVLLHAPDAAPADRFASLGAH